MKAILSSLLLAGALFLGAGAAQAQVYVGLPGVRVNVAPPPPRVEVVPVAPSPRHVWVGGHWYWRDNRHVWIPGSYQIAPNPGYTWVQPRWVNEGGVWVYQGGRWAAGPAQPVYGQPAYGQPVYGQPVYGQPAYGQPVAEVYAQSAPPPPQTEVIPVAPSPGHLWVPGHWMWQGRWVWIPGHHELRRHGYQWDQPRWVQTPDGRWRHVPGRWRPY